SASPVEVRILRHALLLSGESSSTHRAPLPSRPRRPSLAAPPRRGSGATTGRRSRRPPGGPSLAVLLRSVLLPQVGDGDQQVGDTLRERLAIRVVANDETRGIGLVLRPSSKGPRWRGLGIAAHLDNHCPAQPSTI